jgi:hypothetical protein
MFSFFLSFLHFLAAARAERLSAAGRANQDVPGAQQDPLQGRQRRAQGKIKALFVQFFLKLSSFDFLLPRLLKRCCAGRDGNRRDVRADYPAARTGCKSSFSLSLFAARTVWLL